MTRFFLCLGAIIALAGDALAQNASTKDNVPTTTWSPHARYGIIVLEQPGIDDGATNQVIDLKTNQILGAIQAPVALAGSHEEELNPWWSADDSLLLWQVDGKWGFATEVLVKIANGKIQSQVDLLNLLQQEILKRTRQAVPAKYAAVKLAGKHDGSWFKDGFAIDCVLTGVGDDLKFPLPFHVFLTSDPKSLPGRVAVDSRMSGKISEDGSITVTDFHLGTNPPARDFVPPSDLPQ